MQLRKTVTVTAAALSGALLVAFAARRRPRART